MGFIQCNSGQRSRRERNFRRCPNFGNFVNQMCWRRRVERDHARTGRLGDRRCDTRKISRQENNLARCDQIEVSGYAHRITVVEQCWRRKSGGIVENRDFVSNEELGGTNGASEFCVHNMPAIDSIESRNELAFFVCFGAAKKIYELDVHALRLRTRKAQLVDVDERRLRQCKHHRPADSVGMQHFFSRRKFGRLAFGVELIPELGVD